MDEITESKKGVAVLDKIYTMAINGLPISEAADVLAMQYLSKNNNDKLQASKSLINNQIAKCATTGFLTGLGGVITLPVAIPADVASNLYVQIRMIASIAVVGGYDICDDSVKTMVYVTLVGMSLTDIAKETGIKFASKSLEQVIKKIPGRILREINKKVGTKLFTKAGEKGIINLMKLVPVAGGLVGAGFDAVTTKAIAKRAVKAFIK